jgi:hypothetical protein
MSQTFESNKDFQRMRKPFTKEFLKAYNDGFKKYMKGSWSEAKVFFEVAKEIKPDDQPTDNLLKFMGGTNFVPPADWKGYKFFQE